ncbi:MAG: phosphomannomutase/phosphoglucomutase [Gemmatimonadetes bacterium]|nr:phosphomannomutase/phosphoglucomutase [Gemmatimonadota bacterium]
MINAGIFRQYDIRGVVGDDLTIEAAEGIGRGYAAILAERGITGAIAVGRDNRHSGASLRDALVKGLTDCGVDVVDIGVAPTPVLYWSLHHCGVVGGIQVTGSHNPPEFNGFKLSVGATSLHGDGIQRLYQLIPTAKNAAKPGTVRSVAVLDDYVADIAKHIGRIKRPLKVVVDCGNGVGALTAPSVCKALGVEASLLFAESDGNFPNHHPDPTVVENLQDLIREVRRTGAEVGIGFDGDADRIGIVDEAGNIIWGDYLLLLYARDVLERTGKGQSIIFDVKCSQALPDAIRKAGGEPLMWKTGHSLIKEKMKELHAPIAGEMSGHMFFTEGFYGHDDAVYAAARLMRILGDSGKRVDELLADVPRFVSTPELRVDCPDDRKFDIVKAAQVHFAAQREVIAVDGARILFGDGWGLIRASNTQPILVMRFEALTEARLAEIRSEVEGWLRIQGVES